jgi:hypothetical protein
VEPEHRGVDREELEARAARERFPRRALLRGGRIQRRHHQHQIGRVLCELLAIDRQPRLDTAMGQAAASGDLDQVRLVAVSAGEHERVDSDERDHAGARLAEGRAADRSERTRQRGLEAHRAHGADQPRA